MIVSGSLGSMWRKRISRDSLLNCAKTEKKVLNVKWASHFSSFQVFLNTGHAILMLYLLIIEKRKNVSSN